ncbi:MAG: hypothetical protein ACJA0H_000165 [Francisellaceae bacterium]|jgi:hypothetical protein
MHTKIDDITVQDSILDPRGVYLTLIRDLGWINKSESTSLSNGYDNKYKNDQISLLKNYSNGCV